MLAGIYYGAMYGGSTTSILVNIPGEAASVMTCLADIRWHVREGPAGPWGFLPLALHRRLNRHRRPVLIAPVSRFRLEIRPAEYFSLMVLGLTILTFLTSAP